jgi:hypothetical protein
VISTNGFISFNAGLASAYNNPVELPDGIGDVNVAPFWMDLDQVVVCTKTTGTKTTIQWTGGTFDFLDPVQFQVILDTADNSMEFVYGPGHMSDGTDVFFQSPAIAGVQNTAGDDSTTSGDANVAPFATANTSLKLTHP